MLTRLSFLITLIVIGSSAKDLYDDLFVRRDLSIAIPKDTLAVQYTSAAGTKDIIFASTVPQTDVSSSPPVIHYGTAEPATFYTIVMLDLDSPSTTEPSNREYIQWFVVNVRGAAYKNSGSGTTLFHHREPKPNVDTGNHRYVVMALSQPKEFDLKEIGAINLLLDDRSGFKLGKFATSQRLDPKAATFFVIAGTGGQPQ